MICLPKVIAHMINFVNENEGQQQKAIAYYCHAITTMIATWKELTAHGLQAIEQEILGYEGTYGKVALPKIIILREGSEPLAQLQTETERAARLEGETRMTATEAYM